MRIARRNVNLLVRHDLIELAHAGNMNISREFEEFLTHRLAVNSPPDEIRAKIVKTKAELAALEVSLAQCDMNKPSRELSFWKERYRVLGKTDSKMVERWITRVAKMLKMDPKELKEGLEATQ